MKILNSRFSIKFVLITSILLVVISTLATLFYLSTERFYYHLERSRLSQNVLVNYLAVSHYTYRKLSAMGEIVADGNVNEASIRSRNAERLREALKNVRKGIAHELTYEQDKDEIIELELFSEIENISERILVGSTNIQNFLKNGDKNNAQQELDILRSNAIEEKFGDLIDQALAEEQTEVIETDLKAKSLERRIKILLPGSILLVLIPSLIISFFLYRRLTLSIQALQETAQAYSKGDLEHRTPLLSEREFSDLGVVFNHMAEELILRRKATEQSQVSLETMVQSRTQELEQLNNRLASMDNSRRQLFSNISHELRTPLTIIRGETEMALRGASKTTEEYQDTLNRVQEQTLHTVRLVEDLLFIARAEEDKARIEKHSVNIVKILKNVIRDFQSITSKKGITLKSTYENEDIVVLEDSGRLQQVFVILIDNAIRYSHNRGIVYINQSLPLNNSNLVKITVEDQGIGLTENEAKQVFSRFYRSDSAKHHTKGTGLGLPVAKAIINSLNGEISLAGKPNQGAIATVQLPIATQEV